MAKDRGAHNQGARNIPIKWHIPDDLHPVYANNLLVQHSPHEFRIAFYDLEPPLLVGSDEEQAAQLAALEHIRARCVAQVVVSPTRLRDLIEALQKNLETYEATMARAKKDDLSGNTE